MERATALPIPRHGEGRNGVPPGDVVMDCGPDVLPEGKDTGGELEWVICWRTEVCAVSVRFYRCLPRVIPYLKYN